MKKLNVAVIGLGALGSRHASIYSNLNDVNLLGVCDIDNARVKKMAETLNTAPFISFSGLLDKVDAVSIVTPTSSHYEIARQFLLKGVNVLIEKPITKTLLQAEKLIDLAREKGLTLQVGHVERFNSAVGQLKKMARQPRFIEVHRLGPYTPRVKDVGVVVDLMIHDIDILLSIVGSDIKNVEAVGVNVISPLHEDIANARITFNNGCVANLTASRLTEKAMRKIRIFQEDAYISLDYLNQSARIHRKAGFRISISDIDIKREEPLRLEIESFINHACPGPAAKKSYIDEEAKEALRVALEITEKIKEGLDASKKNSTYRWRGLRRPSRSTPGQSH